MSKITNTHVVWGGKRYRVAFYGSADKVLCVMRRRVRKDGSTGETGLDPNGPVGRTIVVEAKRLRRLEAGS